VLFFSLKSSEIKNIPFEERHNQFLLLKSYGAEKISIGNYMLLIWSIDFDILQKIKI